VQLDKVKRTAGDYNAADLGHKLSRESVRDAILTGYIEHARDRQGVVFAPTVDTAEFFREAFVAAGIASEGLYGVTKESRAVHERHKRGTTQVLFSCTRLSAGWDAPWVSAGVIARPTLHSGLFVQMIGRLCRLHPGKTNALVLDPTGVLFRHELEGVIDLSQTMRPDHEIDAEEDDGLDDLIEEDEPAAGADGVDAVVSGYEDVNLISAPWLHTRSGIPFGFSHEQGHAVVRWVVGPPHSPYGTYSVAEAPLGNIAAGRWIMNHVSKGDAYRALPDRRQGRRAVRSRRPNRSHVQIAQTHRVTWENKNVGQIEDDVAVVLTSAMLDVVPSWR
jgi:superfamily II DNA or RNA helicase